MFFDLNVLVAKVGKILVVNLKILYRILVVISELQNV